MTCQCGSVNAVGCLEDHQRLILALPGLPGGPGKDGEPGPPGLADWASVAPLPTPLDTTELVVLEGDIPKRTPWSAFKARIASWLETVEATWAGKTLVDPKFSGSATLNDVPVVTTTGVQQISDKTLVSPRISSIWSSNNVAVMQFVGNAGNTAYARVAVAGTVVSYSVNGPDPDISVLISGKGNGTINCVSPVTVSGVPVVTTAGIQTLSQKTLASPTLTGSPVLNGSPVVSSVAVPATSASTGGVGQIAGDNNFLYVCVATNNWRRVALTTW